MPDLNVVVFELLNQIAGQFWLLDSVIALSLANELIKSAPIGACFLAAWFSHTDQEAVHKARRTLLLTLLAVVGTLGTTQLISRIWIQPRPYLRTHKIYELKSNQLAEMPRIDFRQPLDNRAREREQAAQSGNIPPEDLRAFPSDHAALFLCVSMGIFVARRGIGLLALGWTLAVVVAGKVIPGMHAPVEILAGAAIGFMWLCGILIVCRMLVDRPINRFVAWTTAHPCVTAGFLFIAVFEIASTFDHAKAILSAVGKHV